MAKSNKSKLQKKDEAIVKFRNVDDALKSMYSFIEKKDLNNSDYHQAVEYLAYARDKMTFRTYFQIPGSCGNIAKDSRWDYIKSSSEEECNCGLHRIMLPTNPRRNYVAGKKLTLSEDIPVYLRPIGGNQESAYLKLEISHDFMHIDENPFAHSSGGFLDMMMGSAGAPLAGLEKVLGSKDREKLILAEPMTHVPVLKVTDVYRNEQKVDIVLDSNVEEFTPKDDDRKIGGNGITIIKGPGITIIGGRF